MLLEANIHGLQHSSSINTRGISDDLAKLDQCVLNRENGFNNKTDWMEQGMKNLKKVASQNICTLKDMLSELKKKPIVLCFNLIQ